MSSERSSQQAGGSRLIVIGGFLAAGKTTAITRFATYLKDKSIPATVLVNDFGNDLVDTTLLEACGIPARILPGNSFAHSEPLSNHAEPGIILLEPVGTSRHITATLMEPWRKSVGSSLAPLSILVDPHHAVRHLGLESNGSFPNSIRDLYRDQLSEAAYIVLNKSEGLAPAKLEHLRDTLMESFSHARVFTVSAAAGAGLEAWFECLISQEAPVPRSVAAASPGTPAEAALGWLNCSVSLSSIKYFEGGKLLVELAMLTKSLLHQENIEIAHLKMAFKPEHDSTDIAALSFAYGDTSPRLLREVSEPVQRADLILNARAQGDPEVLHSVINRALLALMERSPELFARMQHCEHFKPVRAGYDSLSHATAQQH